MARVRFIRSAQALGFSLAEIRTVLPQLARGGLGRAAIEQRLHAKIAEIDEHVRKLGVLKRELVRTFDLLTCEPEPLSSAGAQAVRTAPSASVKRRRPTASAASAAKRVNRTTNRTA